VHIENYADYLKSAQWKQKSSFLKKARGYRCDDCGKTFPAWKLHCHHITYKNLGNELDSDLEILCATCHHSRHTFCRLCNKVIWNTPLYCDSCKSILWKLQLGELTAEELPIELQARLLFFSNPSPGVYLSPGET